MLPDLLTARRRRCGVTAAIRGRPERSKVAAPHPQDMTCNRIKFKHYMNELQKEEEYDQVASKNKK